jgi:hypothetical protein
MSFHEQVRVVKLGYNGSLPVSPAYLAVRQDGVGWVVGAASPMANGYLKAEEVQQVAFKAGHLRLYQAPRQWDESIRWVQTPDVGEKRLFSQMLCS